MTLDSIRYFARLAAEKWDQPARPLRACAEDAWFVLFSLRVNAAMLPAEAQASFLELWEAFGGGDPVRLTHPEVNAMLDALGAAGLRRCQELTREFAASLESTVTEHARVS
jgi:hypothetical protein